MESAKGRAAFSKKRAGACRIKTGIAAKAIPFCLMAKPLLLGRDSDHASETVRAVLRVRLRDSVEPDHRNLRRWNARKGTDRSELLIVEIDGGVGVSGSAVDAGLPAIGEKIRTQF